MEQGGHILFLDRTLTDYFFGHVALSKGLTITSGQSKERTMNVGFRGMILGLLSAGGKVESAVTSEDKVSRELTDLEILQLI
jgi:hypothetical protein